MIIHVTVTVVSSSTISLSGFLVIVIIGGTIKQSKIQNNYIHLEILQCYSH